MGELQWRGECTHVPRGCHWKSPSGFWKNCICDVKMHNNLNFCLKFIRTHINTTVSHAKTAKSLMCYVLATITRNELVCNIMSRFVSCIRYSCSSGFLHASVGSWALLKHVNCNVVSPSVKILVSTAYIMLFISL